MLCCKCCIMSLWFWFWFYLFCTSDFDFDFKSLSDEWSLILIWNHFISDLSQHWEVQRGWYLVALRLRIATKWVRLYANWRALRVSALLSSFQSGGSRGISRYQGGVYPITNIELRQVIDRASSSGQFGSHRRSNSERLSLAKQTQKPCIVLMN